MIEPDEWRLTFKESCWVAVGMAFLFFIADWSGFNQWEPDLFFPRPLRDVWWHLPVALAFMLGAIQMARLLDWAKDRPWPYWIAYVVMLVAVVGLTGWLLVQIT